MISLCQGCPHLKPLAEGEFTCAKSRCVVPVGAKPAKGKAPAPAPKPAAKGLLILNVHHAGWSKRQGDKVRIDDPGTPWHGMEFVQKSNEVVVLNKQMYIHLKKLPGELAPLRICR